MKVYIDFETASEVNLKKVGTSVYSNHPSTEILCAILIYEDGSECKLSDIKNEDVLVAHNAIFEQLICKNVLKLDLPPYRWRDTMAKLCAYGLPRSLEKGAEALKLDIKKDMAGNALMRKMCKPGGPRDETSIKRLVEYCKADVLTTMALDTKLPDLSAYEQKVWELDQEINLHGVRIDIPFVKDLKRLVEYEKEELTKKFQTITGLNSPKQAVAFKNWINSHGYDLKSVDAKSLLEFTPIMAQEIEEAIEIRQILGKSSIAKLDKFLNYTDKDGRLRNNLLYHGAGTGRWTGRDAQLQNLPRPKKGIDVDFCIESIGQANIFWKNSMAETTSSLLRSCIIPTEGKVFIGGDYSGIEARVCPWVAGQDDALEIFRQGKDPYCEEATKTFNRPITKADGQERQVGKCSVLGLGFQGGIGAYKKMCDIYGVSLLPIKPIILGSATNDEMRQAEFCWALYSKKASNMGMEILSKDEALIADILKQRWRNRHPKIVAFWHLIENKAIEIVKTKAKTLKINDKLSFRLGREFLHLILPSGRELHYFHPWVKNQLIDFIEEGEGEAVFKDCFFFMGMNATTKQLVPETMYGGKWTENVVQAIARDIMVCGMFNVKNYGGDIVLSIHDELLLENGLETNLKEIESCFTKNPDWALDLPLAAECWKGNRYQK